MHAKLESCHDISVILIYILYVIYCCGPEAALAPPRVRFHEPQARDCSYGMHTDHVRVISRGRMFVLDTSCRKIMLKLLCCVYMIKQDYRNRLSLPFYLKTFFRLRFFIFVMCYFEIFGICIGFPIGNPYMVSLQGIHIGNPYRKSIGNPEMKSRISENLEITHDKK